MEKFKFYLLLCSVLLFIACGSNTENLVSSPAIEEEDEPIENISYADKIQPIFNTTCGGSGCHTSGGSANGVNLAGYAQAINSVGINYGGRVIISGNANSSPLVDKIEPSPEHGSRMPLGRSPLTNTQIETIRVWINEGASNN